MMFQKRSFAGQSGAPSYIITVAPPGIGRREPAVFLKQRVDLGMMHRHSR
jgi:hypothetical protein